MPHIDLCSLAIPLGLSSLLHSLIKILNESIGSFWQMRGNLTGNQRAKILIGIKPSLDRLGEKFVNFELYASFLKQAPFFQPRNSYLDNYYPYGIENVEGRIRSVVQSEPIQHEILNLKEVGVSYFY